MKKTLLFLLLPLLAMQVFAQDRDLASPPIVDYPVYFDISPPLRDMIREKPVPVDKSWKSTAVKNYFNIHDDPNQPQLPPDFTDPGLQTVLGPLTTDTTLQNFSGLGNVNGSVPPDTEGDVGPNHYFQVVNTSYAIYSKTGSKLLGPLASSSIWSGMPNNLNSGDAIVLYDEQANRWLFSQFSLPSGNTNYMMIAISQTPDPMGSWYRYQYAFSQMPDYPKFGVWPDGYYMSANRFNISTGQFAGTGVYAYDRAAMLAGSATATRISFTFGSGAEIYSALPADCDGAFPPAGTPNYFSYIVNSGTQHLGIYEFHADFVNTTQSTITKKANLNVTAFQYFTGSQGVPQLGSNRLLDPMSDRLMNRLQYRRTNGLGSMVVNHTIKTTSGTAGIRWYELRKSTGDWTLYQQGTYAPADGRYRWMGSIAQDTSGNIALGFSIAGTTTYPSIGYTGRLGSDALNQMTISERRIANGTGSQTGIWGGRSRWGDYSSMRVDPANPTTFWYTQEYYLTTSESNWVTQIASFSFEDVFSSFTSAYPVKLCEGDSSQLDVFAFGGSGNYTYSWTSLPAGFTSTLQNPKVGPDTNTIYYVAISDGAQVRNDSTMVNVQQRQTVFAGNDTIVNKFVDTLFLHGTAANYRLIGWVTTGDGSFTDPSVLITSYIPGNNDRNSGGVDLKLVALPVSPCSGNLISTMHVTFDEFVAIADPGDNTPGLTIQPNPARGNLTIIISGATNQKVQLTICDVAGKTRYSENVSVTGNNTVRQIDLSTYPKGVYMVQMLTNGHLKTKKLIVQ